MKKFYRVYFMNCDGRRDYLDFKNKDEAIEEAKERLYAWGYEDKYVAIEEHKISNINFKEERK